MYTSCASSSTSIPAGRPSTVVSALFVGAVEGCPIWRTNFPSFVNLMICRCLAPLPPIHTLPSFSTQMPCSEAGQSYPVPGPPQDLRSLPSASNSRTGGAATQHSERGGFCAAPSSSTVSEPGRCSTQMWFSRSTVSPPTCPIIQLFGSSLGHDASTLYAGASCANAGPLATIAKKQNTAASIGVLVHFCGIRLSASFL